MTLSEEAVHFTLQTQEEREDAMFEWFSTTCPDNSCVVPEHPPLMKTTASTYPPQYDWHGMYTNYLNAFRGNPGQRVPLMTALAEDALTYGPRSENARVRMPQAYYEMYVNLFTKMREQA